MLNDKEYNLEKAIMLASAIITALGAITFFLMMGCGRFFIEDYNPSPPSSTAGLAFVFIPLCVCVAGFVGAFIGDKLSAMVKKRFGLEKISQRNLLCFVVVPSIFLGIAVSALAGNCGFSQIQKYAECDRIGLFYTDGRIIKIVNPVKTLEYIGSNATQQSILKIVNPVKTPDDSSPNVTLQRDPVVIEFHNMKVTVSDDGMKIEDETNNLLSSDQLSCSYVTGVQSIEVKLFPKGERYLAILAELRATSKRAVLFMYSPEGKLIYKEKIKRKVREFKVHRAKLADDNCECLVILNENIFVYSATINNNTKK